MANGGFDTAAAWAEIDYQLALYEPYLPLDLCNLGLKLVGWAMICRGCGLI